MQFLFGFGAALSSSSLQLCPDEIIHENCIHKIRKQRKTLLPSSGRQIDIYNNPQKFGAHLKDRLIHIPDEIIDDVLQKYDCPDLLQFGTDDTVHLMEQIHQKTGPPKLSARVGWSVLCSDGQCVHCASDWQR